MAMADGCPLGEGVARHRSSKGSTQGRGEGEGEGEGEGQTRAAATVSPEAPGVVARDTVSAFFRLQRALLQTWRPESTFEGLASLWEDGG